MSPLAICVCLALICVSSVEMMASQLSIRERYPYLLKPPPPGLLFRRYKDEDYNLDDEWDKFKGRFFRKYECEDEESEKKDVFHRHLLNVTNHNKWYEVGGQTYKQRINKFADYDHAQFAKMMNGYKQQWHVSRRNRNLQGSQNGGGNGGGDPYNDTPNTSTFQSSNGTVPDTFDWRQKGAVSSVKDQGVCGSCYTFSAIGAMEGQVQIQQDRLLDLSEQNLLDCSGPQGNNGCQGGIMDSAFEYIHLYGINSENNYPYTGQVGRCMYNQNDVIATCTGMVDIPEGDEQALKEAIATAGPVSVAIDASHPSFQFYDSGIYYERDCSSDALDHAVLAVGYGTEDGTDYWLVKNSWGTDWGIGGYIKMLRNYNNHCGIATIASYPTVNSA